MVSERQSVGRALMTLAAVAVLLGGLYLANSVLGLLLMAIFFALLCHPIMRWLMGRGLPHAFALALVTIGLVVIFVGLALLVGVSVAQLTTSMAAYRSQLAQQSQDLRDRLAEIGVGAPDQVAAMAVNPDLLVQFLASFIAGIASFLATSFYVLILIVFLLIEGPDMFARARRALGVENPLITRLQTFSPVMVRYFGLRTYLNALTGIGVAIVLFLLGIDYAALWGVLLFFLSYVPYIGIFVASLPPTFLALAEYGPGRAVLVVLGITVVNVFLENIVFPRMVGRGLSLSATVVLLSFFVWRGLLGAPGALLSVFITVLVLLILDSYEETRWIAQILTPEPRGGRAPAGATALSDSEAPSKP